MVMYDNEFQLSLLGMVMLIMSLKHWKIKFQPRIKLNHNIAIKKQQPASKCIETTSCEQEAGGIVAVYNKIEYMVLQPTVMRDTQSIHVL